MFALTGFDDSLFDQLRRMQQEVEEILGDGGWRGDIRSLPRGNFPAINVGNSPDKVDVYLFAPGIDPKTLDISVQESVLVVAGKREPDRPAAADSGDQDGSQPSYYRQERFHGEFRRVVALPNDIDPERIQAKYRDGVVHVAVHRRESARPRQIAIN